MGYIADAAEALGNDDEIAFAQAQQLVLPQSGEVDVSLSGYGESVESWCRRCITMVVEDLSLLAWVFRGEGQLKDASADRVTDQQSVLRRVIRQTDGVDLV